MNGMGVQEKKNIENLLTSEPLSASVYLILAPGFHLEVRGFFLFVFAGQAVFEAHARKCALGEY